MYDFTIARAIHVFSVLMWIGGVAFVTLVVIPSIRANHPPAERLSAFWQGVLGTRAVLAGVATVAVAQFAFTYLPPMQAVFATRPVSLSDGVAILLVGIVLLAIVEAEKRIAALVSVIRDRSAFEKA